MSLRKRSHREEEKEEEEEEGEGEGGGENGGSLAIDTVSVYIVDATGYKLLYTCVLYVLLSAEFTPRSLSCQRITPNSLFQSCAGILHVQCNVRM